MDTFNNHAAKYIADLELERKIKSQLAQATRNLIHIYAPQKMGKSLLWQRIRENYPVNDTIFLQLDLKLAEKNILNNLERFLGWLGQNILEQLDYPQPITEFNLSTEADIRNFFQQILASIETKIVIAIEQLELIFNYPQVAKRFFDLLIACKRNNLDNSWMGKLSLVLIYSTEKLILLPQHPIFDLGFSVSLSPWTSNKIQQLVKRYSLPLGKKIKKNLPNILLPSVGGNPYLINLALANLEQKTITVQDLAKISANCLAIYREYLVNYWTIMPQRSLILNLLGNLDNTNNLNNEQLLILKKLGFVAEEAGNYFIPTLYIKFFQDLI